jgi:hypothetical protein
VEGTLRGGSTALDHRSIVKNADSRPVTKLRDRIAKKMTPNQIAEAQKLAREWSSSE